MAGTDWRSQDILAADLAHVFHPYTRERTYRDKRPPLLVRRAEGPFLYDDSGRAYLDGNASWWCCLLGHRHPSLVEALKSQLDVLDHASLAGLVHEPACRAAAALARVAPPGLSRAFFSDNGSTAVETALKLALCVARLRGETGRTGLAALERGFHGETAGCMSVSGMAVFHHACAPLTIPVTRLPSPALAGLEPAWERAERTLRAEGARLAAVIVEPLVQGAGGMLMYGEEYLRRLRHLTRELGLLLIADEVFTGLGRTGSFWAVDRAGIAPDMLCASKGLSGGMLPFAATLVAEDIFQEFLRRDEPFCHGHTFTGNPLGCALAERVVGLVEQALPGVAARAAAFAAEMEAFRGLPRVRDVRTTGLIGAVELEGSGYLDDSGWRVYDAALRRGLYARPLGSVLYLLPMLTMDDGVRQDMVDRLFQAAREVLATPS